MSKKVGMISLGCPKNQVDGEIMLSKLADNGFEITNDVDGADVVIVNTCGFIEDAKKEAIENILDMVELKKEGVIRKIVVTGCLLTYARYAKRFAAAKRILKPSAKKPACRLTVSVCSPHRPITHI